MYVLLDMTNRQPRFKFDTLRAFVEARQKAGESQGQIAEDLGITQSYLSYLLAGKRTASLRTAVRIAQRAGIPIESLIGREALAS